MTGPDAVAVNLAAARDTAVVRLRGEFDIDSVPHVDVALRRSFGPLYHRRHLVLDLSAATLVDSTFVAFVVRLSRLVREAGHEVVLACPRGHVRRTLLLVGLPNLLPVYDSLDEAVAAASAATLPIIPPLLPTQPSVPD